MADFSTAAMLELEVDESSLRQARSTIEDELGGAASASGGGGAARADGGLGAGGSGLGRMMTSQTTTLEDQSGMLSTMADLADERNEILWRMLDELEGIDGGGGGGLLGRIPGLGKLLGGLAGGLGGLGLGALALEVGVPDLPTLEVPDLPELDVPEIDPLEVNAPDSIPVDAPAEIPVSAPTSIPLAVPAATAATITQAVEAGYETATGDSAGSESGSESGSSSGSGGLIDQVVGGGQDFVDKYGTEIFSGVSIGAAAKYALSAKSGAGSVGSAVSPLLTPDTLEGAPLIDREIPDSALTAEGRVKRFGDAGRWINDQLGTPAPSKPSGSSGSGSNLAETWYNSVTSGGNTSQLALSRRGKPSRLQARLPGSGNSNGPLRVGVTVNNNIALDPSRLEQLRQDLERELGPRITDQVMSRLEGQLQGR